MDEHLGLGGKCIRDAFNSEWVISKPNGTSTPKGSYSAKTGVKLTYESKQSPLEENVMVKWVQSPRQDVKSRLEKKSNSFNVQ